MRDIGDEVATNLIGVAQRRDVVKDEDRAAAPRARDRHDVRDEKLAGIPIELHFHRWRRLPAQRSRQLRGDVRMADHFQIVTILGGLRKAEHRPHGRIRQHQPSGAVDEHDAFHHPGQNRLHVRAFARHLGEPGAELSRRVVEDVRDRTNLVAPVVACRPAEISSLVPLGRVHDGAQPPVDDH